MSDVELVNLTGHVLVLSGEQGGMIVLQPQGRARVSSDVHTERKLNVDGVTVPLLRITEQEAVSLPEQANGRLYVVSGIVAAVAALHGREDVVAPGRVVKERHGKVESARALVRIERK